MGQGYVLSDVENRSACWDCTQDESNYFHLELHLEFLIMREHLCSAL